MKVIDTFDTEMFEPYRRLGIDMELAVKLAVAGKSIAPSLYKVDIWQVGAVALLEDLIRTHFGSLKAFIESDYEVYKGTYQRRKVGEWVKAGAFAEEMQGYAEATKCESHMATSKKTQSTCYGALFYYLQKCDLTDPMVSESTNLCHLDAMVDRVTTREALNRFLNLLAKSESCITIWHRIVTNGFRYLHPGTNGYKVVDRFLRERPELGDMLNSLQLLGVVEWEPEVQEPEVVEIEVVLPQAPSFWDFIGASWASLTRDMGASEFGR